MFSSRQTESQQRVIEQTGGLCRNQLLIHHCVASQATFLTWFHFVFSEIIEALRARISSQGCTGSQRFVMLNVT